MLLFKNFFYKEIISFRNFFCNFDKEKTPIDLHLEVKTIREITKKLICYILIYKI